MTQDETIMLSGIQHFSICRRQWALIHIEQQWKENAHTAEGIILHRRAHDDELTESRGDLLITRGMRIYSEHLHVTGICDVVEFHWKKDGIQLNGREGKWSVYPVEYKKGASKTNDADRLQLCGQAICLEEMLCCQIPEGSLYYGQTRRRERVEFTEDLREKVELMLKEMYQLYVRGQTPRVRPNPHCKGCSLKEICLPELNRTGTVSSYLQKSMKQEDPA